MNARFLPVLLLTLASVVVWAQSATIKAGDTLRVTCAEEGRLNQDHIVTKDGVILVDFLGVVPVAGLTEAQAAEKIQKRLVDDRILRKATVTVSLANPAGTPQEPPKQEQPPAQQSATPKTLTVVTDKESTFSYTDSATLQDVIRSLGDVSAFEMNAVRIVRAERESVVDTAVTEPGLVQLQAGDRVQFVPRPVVLIDPMVTVLGAVGKPGAVEYSGGMTVGQAVQAAGGILTTASADQVVIERKDGTRIVANIMTGGSALALEPGDKVSVPVAKNRNYIEVAGAVRSPGYMVFTEGLMLSKAIELSGGVMPGAKTSRVQIVPPEPRAKPKTVNYDDIVQGFMGDIALKPGEKVVINGTKSGRSKEVLTWAAVAVGVWWLFGR